MKEREHYGFEYSGAEDPSRMVPALELTDEEVLDAPAIDVSPPIACHGGTRGSMFGLQRMQNSTAKKT